jgi:hypothetical protein
MSRGRRLQRVVDRARASVCLGCGHRISVVSDGPRMEIVTSGPQCSNVCANGPSGRESMREIIRICFHVESLSVMRHRWGGCTRAYPGPLTLGGRFLGKVETISYLSGGFWASQTQIEHKAGMQGRLS